MSIYILLVFYDLCMFGLFVRQIKTFEIDALPFKKKHMPVTCSNTLCHLKFGLPDTKGAIFFVV